MKFHALLERKNTRRPGRRLAGLLPVVLLCVLFSGAGFAGDVVEKRDGRKMEGTVLSVDGDFVRIRIGRNDVRVPRGDVAAIRFEEKEVRPSLKVEIRNVRSSDSVDVLLEDEPVIRDAGTGGSWVNLTPKLKKGNNRLRFRIRNHHAGWGYHLQLKINGKVSVIQCGTPPTFREPCRCCGKEGFEVGVIDDLPVMWIYYDPDEGTAELVR